MAMPYVGNVFCDILIKNRWGSRRKKLERIESKDFSLYSFPALQWEMPTNGVFAIGWGRASTHNDGYYAFRFGLMENLQHHKNELWEFWRIVLYQNGVWQTVNSCEFSLNAAINSSINSNHKRWESFTLMGPTVVICAWQIHFFWLMKQHWYTYQWFCGTFSVCHFQLLGSHTLTAAMHNIVCFRMF